MPAVSEKQARFMRMVHARQRGHRVGGSKVAAAAASMKPGDVEDFMHTKKKRHPLTGKRMGV